MKIPCLSSALFTILASSSILFGGTESWKEVVCSISGNVVFPVDLPLGQTPQVGTSTTIAGAWNTAITPDGAMAVVSDDHSIYALDITGDTITEKFPPLIIPDDEVEQLAITPDGQKAYVCAGRVGVVVIRLSDFAVLKIIPGTDLGGSAYCIGISPTKSEAYVYVFEEKSVALQSTNAGTKRRNFSKFSTSSTSDPRNVARMIQVIDTDSDSIEGLPVSLDVYISDMAITPDGSEIYMGSNEGFKYITTADRILHSITGSEHSGGIAITPNGSTVCAVSRYNNQFVFARINVTTHAIEHRDPLPSELSFPFIVTITPDGNTASILDEGEVGTEGDGNAYNASIAFMDLSGSGKDPVIVTTDFPDATGAAITPDQAPTARFAYSVHGLTATFDGSRSTSDVGSVVTWAWDFGDGQEQTTSSPTVTHTYSNSGTYFVTLTVTNTAGTSTEITFTGKTVSNNGGPSATVTDSITVFPLLTFKGEVTLHHRNKKAVLKTKWEGPSTGIYKYEIWAHDKKIATISAYKDHHKKILLHPHHFPDHLSKQYRDYLRHKYKIRAFDINGQVGPFRYLELHH